MVYLHNLLKVITHYPLLGIQTPSLMSSFIEAEHTTPFIEAEHTTPSISWLLPVLAQSSLRNGVISFCLLLELLILLITDYSFCFIFFHLVFLLILLLFLLSSGSISLVRVVQGYFRDA